MFSDVELTKSNFIVTAHGSSEGRTEQGRRVKISSCKTGVTCKLTAFCFSLLATNNLNELASAFAVVGVVDLLIAAFFEWCACASSGSCAHARQGQVLSTVVQSAIDWFSSRLALAELERQRYQNAKQMRSHLRACISKFLKLSGKDKKKKQFPCEPVMM